MPNPNDIIEQMRGDPPPNAEQATYLLQLWTRGPVTDTYWNDQHHVSVIWQGVTYSQNATWLADAIGLLYRDLTARGLGHA
jgi:hypothetical protein